MGVVILFILVALGSSVYALVAGRGLMAVIISVVSLILVGLLVYIAIAESIWKR